MRTSAWETATEKLLKEIARMRAMGLEVLPKLNFSATHDIWMQDYSRMLSTRKYYQVCEDLIRDVLSCVAAPTEERA